MSQKKIKTIEEIDNPRKNIPIKYFEFLRKSLNFLKAIHEAVIPIKYITKDDIRGAAARIHG
ncbi:MAG: hypothetical protein PF450_08615 [Bacteroidales bacterium]|nr:hypothetical protein [Bacteroidales bacterium]